MLINLNNEIIEFEEKLKVFDLNLVFMGIYLFDFKLFKKVFEEMIVENLDFGKYVIFKLI